MLPAPDVVLSERIVLCETALGEDSDVSLSSSGSQAPTVCDVLQLAARKRVGCAVGEGVVEAEPQVVLSPDCKHLAVKEPCSRRVCLLSAQEGGFKEVLTTLVPLPVALDGQVGADTILSCSWSADSRLLLLACKSSALYLFDSTGRLLCHWDPTWPWAKLQLVAACHGPGDTILVLTAARVVFLVKHSGDKQQRGSSAGSEVGMAGTETAQQLQFHEQRVLGQFPVKRQHTSVSAIGYDEKSGLLVVAGDSGAIAGSSSGGSAAGGSSGSSSGSASSSRTEASPADAFAAEGVTVSVWHLQQQGAEEHQEQWQLKPRFALGTPQGRPGMLASTVASALGVDRAALSAAAATRWSVVFSPLLEYVALLTGGGSVYLLSLTDNCLVDPTSGFAGRSAGSHSSAAATAASSSGSSSSSTKVSPRERGPSLKPKHVPLTPHSMDGAGSPSRSGSCNRSVAWWGPRVLAVAAADGSVSLVRLPESVNILGAAPARFAPGARVVANHSGSRGLLVVEPISAAMAAAAAGASAPGAAAAAMANSLQLTTAEAVFAADASAAVGFSTVLAARRTLAAAASRGNNSSSGGGAGGVAGSDRDEPKASYPTRWLARHLDVHRDELQAATAAAAGSAGIAGWRLVLLAERTPQQLVQVHLRLQDWGSALQVSNAYGLDTDAVYLARWSATPVSRASIADNLPKINSDRLKVSECLTRIAPDYESARLLISFGLKVTMKKAAPPEKLATAATEHAAAAAAAGSEFATPVKGGRPAAAAGAAPPGTPGGLSGPAGPNSPLPVGPGPVEAPRLDSMPAAKAAEVRWWRLQRLKLLALHDRLETSVALKRGSYDPEIFSVLRTEPLPKAAAALAAAGNVGGLQTLLLRHKSTLAPRLLPLLSALPESLDPRMYSNLIPRASAGAAAAAAAGPAAAAVAAPRLTRPVGIGNMHGKAMRKVDWVESEETFQFLAAAAAGSGNGGLGSLSQHSAAADAHQGAHAGGFASALSSAPSLESGPGLPIALLGPAEGAGGAAGHSSSSSSSFGLSSQPSSNLDFSKWALSSDESSIMMHATEELERHCSVNGANKRTLPTDAEIAAWMAARALQLDASTGQLPDALQLLDLAADKGYGMFHVPLPLSSAVAHSSSLLAAGAAAAGGALSGDDSDAAVFIPISHLMLQGKVLLQLVKSWWPVDQHGGDGGDHAASSDGGREGQQEQQQRQSVGAGGAAGEQQPSVVEAAAAALQPLWSVTLRQWVSVGLLPQLFAVLGGSSRDLLQQDLQDRVLLLLQCYPHEQRVTALQQLLVYWVAGPASSTSAHAASGTTSSGSGGGSSSNGIMLAAALLSGETELLQAAAAAASVLDDRAGRSGSSVVSAISAQQQQQLLVAQAAAGGDGSLGPLLWDGDVSAMAAAVLAAVLACRATNQWARVEQLLDAAADALLAAGAVSGVRQNQGSSKPSTVLARGDKGSSGDSSYSSADSSEEQAADMKETQHQQQQSKQRPKDGWGDEWSSEGEGDERGGESTRAGQQQQQQKQVDAALAATEPLRAAVLQHPTSAAQLQALQTQVDLLRGQVRAARLLTKHGCCVTIGEVAGADAAAAKDWLQKLLSRAERLGASWPEAQWAQVWHDLLEARQSGLSSQLPASELAAAFLRVLLLAQQYHLAVQLLPMYSQQQQQQYYAAPGGGGGTPTAGTPIALAGLEGGVPGGAFDLAMDAALAQQQQQQHGERPSTAEAALAALTGGAGAGGGGAGHAFTGSSRFGVRRALHNAAGAAVSTAVGRTAKLMGVSAHLVGSTAHLVGSTAQAVQYGAGGMVGATAGLVSGTASLVSSAATFAAEAAAKAGSRTGVGGKGSSVGGSAFLQGAGGLLTMQEAEGVVVQVSQELLASAASLEDPAVAAAEAVLQLLPPECKAAARHRDTVAVLRHLPEFGVSLLPAQLTSLPDKQQLLQRILFGRHTYAAAAAAAASGSSGGWSSGSSVAPWRRLGDVLELAALLGFDSEDEQNEVRLMAAEAALSAGEVGVATHLCLQLAAVRYGPAWHLAAELACPQRFAAQRQQRAAKVRQLVQQEQQVEQQLRESQQDTAELPENSGDNQPQQQQQQAEEEGEADRHAAAAAAGDDGSGEQEQQQLGPLAVAGGGGDGEASSVSIKSPSTPGAAAPTTSAATTAVAAAGADADEAVAASQSSNADDADELGYNTAPAAAAAAAQAGDITPADIEGAKPLSAEAQSSDAGLQPPKTPVAAAAAAAAAADGADASATVVESAGRGDADDGAAKHTAQPGSSLQPEPSNGGATAAAVAAARLALPPKDRQKLLAFAACYCPSGELPALTDDLVLVQHEVTRKEALRQQQKLLQQQQQHGGSQQQQQQDEQEDSSEQDLSVLLPLQQPASPAFQHQRQQLVRSAVAAAAAAPYAISSKAQQQQQVDPFKGLFSFGDPQALLAVLLSCDSAAEAQQLFDDALAHQLNSSSSGSGAAASPFAAGGNGGGSSGTGSFCCLQRLLVVGATAQLLRVLQPLPEAALVEVVAASPGSKASCGHLKLPHHQELLLQLLHVPLPQLQSAVSTLLQRPPQQQQLLPPGAAADALAAAKGSVSRLRQISDGRQLLQWLPGIETGRFFAGDKAYQEQVLIQLASKAGQMAVQPPSQQQQPQSEQQQAAAEALMAQAQQLAASYGADPFQLELWFVHSLVLYAPDIQAPEAQALLAAHAQQLLAQPAAAAAHLYHNTYPLLPAAAAAQCSCVLGLIHAALQFCAQQQTYQQQQQPAAVAAAGGSVQQQVPAAVLNALPPLDKLKDLLVKSSKALAGLAAKALIGGHVALMVGPAVAAAAAMTAAAAAGDDGTASAPPEPQQQQDQQQARLAAATSAAAAAVAAVDLQMVLLEAASAVCAFVVSPAQAAVVAKFIRHMNTLAEMHARASVGDKPKQQVLQKLAQGVSPGLPHLLLVMKTLSSDSAPPEQQQQPYWADAEERSEGLTRQSSVESFQSAVSVTSSLSGSNSSAALAGGGGGHNPAAALAIEQATARARYASTSGRQQLLNCSALQLSGLAGWLALSQAQPVAEDAIGPLRPLAIGPGLQLQLLSDVITLITNPEAQLPGLVGGLKRISSGGGSSRGSGSFAHSNSLSAEQAAATAMAAAAVLTAGAVPGGSITPLMRDDPAAIAAWQPPSMPAALAPKRRELVVPLLQAASRIVAKHVLSAALVTAAAAPPPTAHSGPSFSRAAAAAAVDAVSSDTVAVGVNSSSAEEQQQQQGITGSSHLRGLLDSLVAGGSISAVTALQLVQQLASLQWALSQATGQQQQLSGASAAAEASTDGHAWAVQQALQVVSSVLQQQAAAALDSLQQQVAAEAAEDGRGGDGSGAAAGAGTSDGLRSLQRLISCLEQEAPTPRHAAAAAATAGVGGAAAAAVAASEELAEDADSATSSQQGQQQQQAVPQAAGSSWVFDSIQQLRSQLWDQLQQHQAQLPAEAYSSSLIAELLELQETISTGAAWPGWAASTAAGAGASAGADGAGAAASGAAAASAGGAVAGAAAAVGDGGGRPKGSGAGLLLARTMTALSKQFPGLKASADDLASVEAAVGLFTRVLAHNSSSNNTSSNSSTLSPAQCAALTSLLKDTWKEGAALPEPQRDAEQAAAAAEEEQQGASKPEAAAAAAEGDDHKQVEQRLAESVGLPLGVVRVSQLHSCWYQLLSSMLAAGCVQDLLALLDGCAAATTNAAAAAASGAAAAYSGDAGQQQQQQQVITLPLQESEAEQLVAAAGVHLGPAGQAVLGLLLPYRTCQEAVMQQLLQGQLVVGAREAWAGQLLLLLLLRGQLAQLAASDGGGDSGGDDSSSTKKKQQQLYHLYSLLLQPVLAAPPESSGLAWAYLTCLFPHAVAQLCQIADYAAAAALVAAKMRTAGSLCTLNGALLLLQRYLEVTMQRPWQQQSPGSVTDSPLWLPCCEALMASRGAGVAAAAHTQLLGTMRGGAEAGGSSGGGGGGRG